MYEYADKVTEYIDKQLIRRYSRLKSLVSFDELNVLQSVNSLYQELDVIIRKMFLLIARKTYLQTVKYDYGSIDEEWVDNFLNGYDPVSKYVFTHELDRKSARLVEAIMASTTKTKEIDAAMRSMSLMIRAYSIRITDEAALQAFRDDGTEYVRWVSERDERTCSICRKRDGKRYSIGRLPPKPHINCRCWYERV